MRDNGSDDTVLERLEHALHGDRLPKAAKDYARHLVQRLSQPVRVSVLGPPGSGKSQLVNMFLGDHVVPEDASLPTTEFAWGEIAQMVVTSNDGNVVKVHGADMSAVSGSKAAFLRVELPIEILKRINLLEVVTDGTVEELTSGVDWVVRRTDIALWCTQKFDTLEQGVWARVPDSLKDHAFMVLTKADVLSAAQQLSARLGLLEAVVAEEFHSLFAVATLQAIHAKAAGQLDETLFHASGGSALTSQVLRHAERGRRADFDSAHMFLARYQVDGTGPAVVATPKPANQTPAPRPVAAKPTLAAVAAPEAAPNPKPQPATVPPVQDVAVQNVTLFTDAVRFLRRRGETLTESAEKLGEGKASGLIESCVSAVEHLVDLFSQDDTGCPAADAFIDDLAEAQDMMVLMQVEDKDGPAADAVTLLLQIRHDMEMQLAA